MLKSILALADGGATTDATLQTALRAVECFDAYLDVLHISPGAEPMAVFATGEAMPMVGVAEETIRQHIETRRAAAKAAYDRVVGANTPHAAWREEEGRAVELLASAGRLCDLLVISRPGDGSDDLFPGCVNTALFETGRAVLVAPPEAMPTIGTRVAVAWNDSIQASRAVAASLPFLTKASEVMVFTAGTATRQAAADRLAHYLGHYGIKARVDGFDPGSGSARARGRAVLRRANDMGADLLVMGAYGQGRMMQFLGLGGATAKVITANTMPLLLAH
jgi:nucleotide-binding universal stress UspA family protein